MSNPYFEAAAEHRPQLVPEDTAHEYLEAEGVDHETMQFSALNRIAEATLALAFEARTANLIAFANACETASVGNGGSFRQAADRLGLGDTK